MSGGAIDGAHVLVVDDDQRLGELLRKFLSAHGFRVTTAGDARQADAKLAIMTFDLLVLDLMLPGESGIDLTRRLRRTSTVPILLLTAQGEAPQRIAGLTAGADDYLAKPFEPDELLLRIRAILRRAPPPVAAQLAEFHFGAFRFAPERGELTRADEVIHLTTAEASLLGVLARAAPAALSRRDLLARSAINGNERTVDVQVTRLRRKIEDDPRQPRHLITVRGAGYQLRVE
jgi:two-component system phosphate regulon response regulator OmpR